MQWFDLVLLGLATWRFSHMLVLEDGPANVFDWLRHVTGIREDEMGIYYPTLNPLHCVWCTSVWVSVLFYFVYVIAYWLVWILAISAICCLIEEWFGERHGTS